MEHHNGRPTVCRRLALAAPTVRASCRRSTLSPSAVVAGGGAVPLRTAQTWSGLLEAPVADSDAMTHYLVLIMIPDRNLNHSRAPLTLGRAFVSWWIKAVARLQLKAFHQSGRGSLGERTLRRKPRSGRSIILRLMPYRTDPGVQPDSSAAHYFRRSEVMFSR